MAYTIRKYATKKGTYYEVRYRKPDGHDTRKRGFARKMDAELWAAENVEIAKAKGTFITQSAGSTPVGELWPSWLAAKSTRGASSYIATLSSSWRTHVDPQWGKRMVGTIRHDEIQKWVSELSERRSPTVVIRANDILRGLLDYAVRNQLIASNPADDITLPRKQRKDHIYLTVEQLMALADEAGWRRPVVLTLGTTGMRWGELVGLRVRDLDATRHRLRIERNAVESGGGVTIGEPKTHEKRTVTYPSILDDVLAGLAGGRDGEAPLFADPQGNMLRRTHGPNTTSSWFYWAKKRALGDRLARKMTVHDLRHTAASLLVSAGANVKVVQRQLGHKSAAMTLDVYADLFDDDLDDVRAEMDSIFPAN